MGKPVNNPGPISLLQDKEEPNMLLQDRRNILRLSWFVEDPDLEVCYMDFGKKL